MSPSSVQSVLRVTATAVLACAGGVWLMGQEPQGRRPSETRPARPTFRAGVNLVQLDVSVLDADRRPVRGLTATDFTVFEEGTPREIVAFTPVDLPRPVGPDTTSAAT
jgi:hypothetical protein